MRNITRQRAAPIQQTLGSRNPLTHPPPSPRLLPTGGRRRRMQKRNAAGRAPGLQGEGLISATCCKLLSLLSAWDS